MPSKLYQAVCYRANPRSKHYMQDLLMQEFPDVPIVDVKQIPSDARTIVLLYRDAIGLGYSYLEGTLIRKKQLIALTGRRRKFALTAIGHFKLSVKRLMELTFLPELIVAPFLIFTATVLAIKDHLSGYADVK